MERGSINQMLKQDLSFSTPYMNAAGTLGFAPDYRTPLPWEAFGAFVTNPLSQRARQPAKKPALIEFAGGFLMHTGLPNPGLPRAIKRYARRWGDSRLPVIVHLMAEGPEATAHMVSSLEGLENIAALEIGFAPMLDEEILYQTIQTCLGELPLIVQLSFEQALTLGPSLVQVGVAAISLAPPRGMVALTPSPSPYGREESATEKWITGRLGGAAVYPQALLTVREAAQLNLPVIGAGGVNSKANAEAMLSAGALAAQVDASLWNPGFKL
jgi:dihydroorotate dehydrogenase (NAD+) catalytic subunit